MVGQRDAFVAVLEKQREATSPSIRPKVGRKARLLDDSSRNSRHTNVAIAFNHHSFFTKLSHWPVIKKSRGP